MSHVDEGLIHAYIDGAFPPGNTQGEEIERHMEVCVDCRVRLEKARDLKDRARLVMQRLAPAAIARPSFDEILARRARTVAQPEDPAATPPAGGAADPLPADTVAGASRGARRRSSVPAMPLAWAASLVLALGAGWMARAYFWAPGFGPADMQTAESVSTEATAGDARREAEPDVSTLDDATALRAPPGADPAAGRADAQGEAAAAAQGAAGPTVADAARIEAAKAVVAPAPSRDSDLAGRRIEAQVPPTAPPIELAAPPIAAANQLLLRAARDSVTLAPVALDEVLRIDPSGTANLRTSVEALAMLRQYVAAGREQGWTDVEPLVATLGYERAAVIEGLEPITVSRTGPADESLWRSLYRLEDGSEVEVIQLREPQELALDEVVVTAAAPGAPPDRADSIRQDPAAGRDSAARRQRVAEDPPVAIERAAPLGDAAFVPVPGLTLVDDSTATLDGATVVAIGRPEGVILLRGAMTEDRLRAIAARIR